LLAFIIRMITNWSDEGAGDTFCGSGSFLLYQSSSDVGRSSLSYSLTSHYFILYNPSFILVMSILKIKAVCSAETLEIITYTLRHLNITMRQPYYRLIVNNFYQRPSSPVDISILNLLVPELFFKF